MEEQKKELLKWCKKILKRNKPKSVIILWQIEANIINLYNQITKAAAKDLLSEENKNCLKYCRRKAILALSALGSRVIVPSLTGIEIKRNILLADSDNYSEQTESELGGEEEEIEEEIEEEEVEETEDEEKDEPMTSFEVAKFVSSTVQEFDGSFRNAKLFLDQVAVVEAIATKDTTALAIKVIITKIKDDALRQKLASVEAFVTLKATVQAHVKAPDIQMQLSKLKAFKQENLSAVKYTESLKMMSNELLAAYIFQGVPAVTAEKLVATTLCESVKAATRNENLKLSLSIHQYQSIDEVINSVLNLSAENSSQQLNFGEARTAAVDYVKKPFYRKRFNARPKWRSTRKFYRNNKKFNNQFKKNTKKEN